MADLTWFKFSPSSWMMGRIQRCPEITQARFINLCCLYWKKECFMSIEDATIEIDKEHIDLLISKKIIFSDGENISIDFLDEQISEFNEQAKNQAEKGKIGNLKRWHPDVYRKYKNKEISLDEALKIIATPSLPDITAIIEQSISDNQQSQNIADKIREDKNRLEEKREEENKEDSDNDFSKIVSIPEWEEFLSHALLHKPNINKVLLKQKYELWKFNGWIDGKNQKIKNWRTKLNNTLPYIEENTSEKKEYKPFKSKFDTSLEPATHEELQDWNKYIKK